MTAKRNVNGVLLLDKPTGLTSNQILQRVKRLFAAKKAGHTGSLDPLATGMLPICFGEATKVSSYLLDADKQYQVVCRFGEKTDTGDSDGTVTASENRLPTEHEVLAVLDRFRGQIEQLPPMYSAIKHQGQRLYALARQGIEVERKSRLVSVNSLELQWLNDTEACFEVSCSKGTYIRVLVEDLAAALGTLAHVTALRRLSVAGYKTNELVTWAELEDQSEQGFELLDQNLRSVDSALDHWPSVELSQDSAYYLCRGQAVRVANRPRAGRVRLYGPKLNFIGIGEVLDDGRVAPKRLMSLA